MTQSAKRWLKREIIERPPQNIKLLEDSQMIHIGRQYLKVIHTPGHSPGGISLYSPENGILFSGDTLFAYDTVGRTDFSYGSEKELKESLEKLSKLPKETIIYPGHGDYAKRLDQDQCVGKQIK
jgi:glyoxylase-like metal-dependent hydrolase (beta-lactamase superfamily II)